MGTPYDPNDSPYLNKIIFLGLLKKHFNGSEIPGGVVRFLSIPCD